MLEAVQCEALALAYHPNANCFSYPALPSSILGGSVHAASRQQPASSKYLRSDVHGDFVRDEREQCSHLAWIPLWLAECSRVLKQSAMVLLVTDWRQLPAIRDAMQSAGFTWRGVAVWDTTEGGRPQLGRFRNQTAYVVWGSKSNTPLDRRASVLPSAIRESVRKADRHHMTGKSTDFMRQLMRICEAGGCILDPFPGSRITVVAARLEGYQWGGGEATRHHW
ncbi:adenine methyltransferase [Stenotrophomonas sp. SAU14A_NAIMI4_8]|nr:adenine methyltransferase [Stenotrophomonas sp. SAU14A_NAIMI4_8]